MGVKARAFLIAFGVLLADQVTKILALSHLSETQPLPVIGETVRLVLRFNEAAAFSIAWGGPVFLLVFNSVASLALIGYMLKMKSSRVVLFLGAILGGALGNLVDRIAQGSVTDFIDLGVGTLRWPVFNVADIAIVAGGALLLLFPGGKGSKNGQE